MEVSDASEDEEYEFLCLSDYGYKTPPDLYSEEELDIISMDSDSSEKLAFELDSEEERKLYSEEDDAEEAEEEERNREDVVEARGNEEAPASRPGRPSKGESEDEEEDEEELPRYATTRIIYSDAEAASPAPTGIVTSGGAKAKPLKPKTVSFAAILAEHAADDPGVDGDDDEDDDGVNDVDILDANVGIPGAKADNCGATGVDYSKPPLKVPTAEHLRRFSGRVRKMVQSSFMKKAGSLSMEGVEARLRLVGTQDVDAVSACVKKAMYQGFVRVEGPHSLLQLICYQRCPGKNCQKIIRVLVHKSWKFGK